MPAKIIFLVEHGYFRISVLLQVRIDARVLFTIFV